MPGRQCEQLPEAAREPDRRQEKDLHVEEEGPVLDVVEVVFQPLEDGAFVSALSAHLRPSRHARLDMMAAHVAWYVVLELVDKVRPLGPRAYKAHIAF